jgi:hypothetical protein
MEHFQRPPLVPLTIEEITQLAHEIDERYWPLIIEFRVAKFIPPSIPVPPQRPLQLLRLFSAYALDLFKSEADRFEQFRDDQLYATWLSNLSNRIAVHLQRVFEHLDKADPNALLLYHGASNLQIDASVRRAMFELIKQYMQGPRTQIEAPTETAVSQHESIGTNFGNRKRIESFISKMAASGLKIKRKDIWRVAGYKDRTEFERFQRGDDHNKTACLNFNRVLNLDVEVFRNQLKSKL